MINVPTKGESFAKLIEYLRKAQEEAAVLAHLARANDDRPMAMGWLAVSELIKKQVHQITQLAMKGVH